VTSRAGHARRRGAAGRGRSRLGGSGRGTLAIVACCVALSLACTRAARADSAPGDSLLDAYVRSMSDSTDAWFGRTAAPLDTAGLDTALAAGLARGQRGRWRASNGRGLDFAYGPALGFNRADGGELGVDASAGIRRLGRLSGRLQYTTGTHDVLGEGAWSKSWRVPGLDARAALRVAAGRYTETFDREHYGWLYSALNAAVAGEDRHQYLRRDGFVTSLRLGGEAGSATVGWRDQLESPLPYTTDWFLFGRGPTLAFNDAAAFGRARELTLSGEVEIPGTRYRLGATHWTSDPRFGSDFRYRRTRVTLGGDVSLGQHLALVQQATYGRLRGQVLPQDAFYLGGSSTLRTLERNELAGAGRTFARVDLMLVDELGALLHVPLPAWLPLQLGGFAASGAVWGSDGAGGALPSTRDGPRREDWLSEVGIGLSWRHGIPDPQSAVRFEYAHPIGADGRSSKFTISFQRPLNLLQAR